MNKEGAKVKVLPKYRTRTRTRTCLIEVILWSYNEKCIRVRDFAVASVSTMFLRMLNKDVR